MKISAVRPVIVGEDRNFFFVVVETDDGVTGIGEGGVTWREDAAAAFVNSFAPLLIDQDPFRTEHLWQSMFRSDFFPAGRVGCAAISAIDIALWDIKAKSLDLPLYQLLGGMVRDRVPCYAHIHGETRENLVEHGQQMVQEGWTYLRFDPRSGSDDNVFEPSAAVQLCIDDFAALRESLGDKVELIVDVHTRLNPSDAVTLSRGLEQYRPFFVEDPLRCENTDSYRNLRRHTAAPIAAGEQFATKWEMRQLIEEDLIDFARIDLCIIGGITEALKVTGWCETHHIRMAFHNPLGPVATAACLHLDLACANFGVQELARPPGTILPELFPKQVTLEQGNLMPPDQPGLGIEFDESAANRYPPVAGGGSPRFVRDDGSFTNW